jgi:hypothetical protein
MPVEYVMDFISLEDLLENLAEGITQFAYAADHEKHLKVISP